METELPCTEFERSQRWKDTDPGRLAWSASTAKNMKLSKTAWFVSDGNRVEFVGKDYAASRRQKIARQRLPGFAGLHRHALSLRASMPAITFLTIRPRPIFASNYLGPLVARSRGRALGAFKRCRHRPAVFALSMLLKSGVTTTFDIGGAGGEPERYVDMVDQVGIRCAAGPSYKNVSFFPRSRRSARVRLGRRARQQRD